MDNKIGEVVHYFDDIGVAVISLSESLAVGDSVTFARDGDELFSQTVTSMEINEEQIDAASAGDEVAIKVEQETKTGTEIYT